MLKILQARLQQYMNHELPDVQAGFRKGRGTRDQIANIRWIIENTREFQKNMYFCFIDYAKAFDCVDHNKVWKILWTEEPGSLQSNITGESHGWRSLVGYSPRGRKESDTTEQLHFTSLFTHTEVLENLLLTIFVNSCLFF